VRKRAENAVVTGKKREWCGITTPLTVNREVKCFRGRACGGYLEGNKRSVGRVSRSDR
jgi:hypothetical protein